MNRGTRKQRLVGMNRMRWLKVTQLQSESSRLKATNGQNESSYAKVTGRENESNEANRNEPSRVNRIS